ncbi:MAG: DUF2911 domain-containing protein [Pyrinomonadaceae bacterium]
MINVTSIGRLVSALLLVLAGTTFATAQLEFPRLSPKADIKQTVGDTQISITYGRPTANGRKIWGGVVPYGKVWRSGANEATVIEISRDATVNGKPLPRGKYSIHTIPGEADWTVIFNKVWDQWGSFDYDEKQDALRITAVPATDQPHSESLSYRIEDVSVNSANVVLSWEELAVTFKVDVGDVLGRTFNKSRSAMISDPINSATFVLIAKLKDKYSEALKWVENSIGLQPSFAAMAVRAELLAASGQVAEAVKAGEAAVSFAKKNNPNVRTGDLEQKVATWRNGNEIRPR